MQYITYYLKSLQGYIVIEELRFDVLHMGWLCI